MEGPPPHKSYPLRIATLVGWLLGPIIDPGSGEDHRCFRREQQLPPRRPGCPGRPRERGVGRMETGGKNQNTTMQEESELLHGLFHSTGLNKVQPDRVNKMRTKMLLTNLSQK